MSSQDGSSNTISRTRKQTVFYSPKNFRSTGGVRRKRPVVNPISTNINLAPPLSNTNPNTTGNVTKYKYVSEICALSYLRNFHVRTKGQFYSKKTANEIYSLVNQYFTNTTTFKSSIKDKTITITNYEDLFMFLYSQYIDVLHDTKKDLEGKEFESFANYLRMVINPSINGTKTQNWINAVLLIQPPGFEKIKKSTMEHDYFDIVTKEYGVSRTMYVQNRETTNRSKYIVFDQSNSNVGRIFSNRFKIVLPIASLADAGMFKNPECKFWRELRDYIDENYVDTHLYKERFNELLDMYIRKHPASSQIKSVGGEFINTWKKQTEYSVGDAFRIFKLRYKLQTAGYTNTSQINKIKFKNTGRVEPCFDDFHFAVKFKHDGNDFTLLDVNYGVNQTDIPGRFKNMIDKKDLKTQIFSLETLFTHGLYDITINNEKAGIKSKSDAYDLSGNTNVTGKKLYIKLMEKHVGDLGPQIWALANKVYYCTGDISGVCQYLVMSHLFQKQGEEVYGAFFETGNRVHYLHNTRTRVNVRQPTRKTTTNQIINNLNKLIRNKTKSNQVTRGNLLYVLKKPRNKNLHASQSLQRPGATPNRSVQRS